MSCTPQSNEATSRLPDEAAYEFNQTAIRVLHSAIFQAFVDLESGDIGYWFTPKGRAEIDLAATDFLRAVERAEVWPSRKECTGNCELRGACVG